MEDIHIWIESEVRKDKSVERFAFSAVEKQHLRYLMELLAPFALYTEAVSVSESGPTIHFTYNVYNELFQHIETEKQKLGRKRTTWKIKMREALDKAWQALQKWYKTTESDLQYVFSTATILSPAHKIQFFEGEDWITPSGEKPYVRESPDHCALLQLLIQVGYSIYSIRKNAYERLLFSHRRAKKDGAKRAREERRD
jgi:hypothetical protein